jgi:hypothetical protein
LRSFIFKLLNFEEGAGLNPVLMFLLFRKMTGFLYPSARGSAFSLPICRSVAPLTAHEKLA